MLEELRRHNAIVQERIMKSFGYADTEDFIQKGEDEYDLEKAHQDGDMHPNGKWVWVSSANGGKGDWRTLNGRAHKKHSDTQASNKFLDALKTVNSKYNDESKVSVMKTPKGNWEVSYDGHVVGTVTSGILSEKVAKEKGWLKEYGRNNEKTTSKTTSSSYFSKLSNSLIEKYSKKKESVSLSDIEEFYEDFLRDRSQEPTRKVYANEAKKTYDAIVANWNKPMSATKVDTTSKLKSVLAATDGVYDEEKRNSNLGAWERDVQKYIENVAVELSKQIGVPFRKNYQGETEVKLGEYSSKDGGSRVEVTLDYDRGIQTYVSHNMAQSAKRTRKGGMVMCIYYPGHGGSCKTINLTEADNTKLKNIVKALKDINKVKIKDLKNVQGYNSEQKTYNLLVKTLKKNNL